MCLGQLLDYRNISAPSPLKRPLAVHNTSRFHFVNSLYSVTLSGRIDMFSCFKLSPLLNVIKPDTGEKSCIFELTPLLA